MDLHQITDTTLPKTEMKNKVLKKYSRPTLLKHGTVIELTTGGSGTLGDVTGPTTIGNVKW